MTDRQLPISELLAASTDLHWRLVAADESGDAEAKIRLRAEFQTVRAELELRRSEVTDYLNRLARR